MGIAKLAGMPMSVRTSERGKTFQKADTLFDLRGRVIKRDRERRICEENSTGLGDRGTLNSNNKSHHTRAVAHTTVLQRSRRLNWKPVCQWAGSHYI